MSWRAGGKDGGPGLRERGKAANGLSAVLWARPVAPPAPQRCEARLMTRHRQLAAALLLPQLPAHRPSMHTNVRIRACAAGCKPFFKPPAASPLKPPAASGGEPRQPPTSGRSPTTGPAAQSAASGSRREALAAPRPLGFAAAWLQTATAAPHPGCVLILAARWCLRHRCRQGRRRGSQQNRGGAGRRGAACHASPWTPGPCTPRPAPVG